MTAPQPIGVGIIGLGFMGRTHLAAYTAAQRDGLPCRVVAVADRTGVALDAAAPSGNPELAAADRAADLSAIRCYREADELLADPQVQLVSICTYTDTHVDLAVRALRAGKHVLVEKPLATQAELVAPLLDAAGAARTLCMPAMCMRFWPAWAWLKQCVDDGRFGRVRSAVFQRLASPPAWGTQFYRDAERSGAALIDLHIHDADFVSWCFGRPAAVSSSGTRDHLTTLYHFESGPPHVVAEGGWDHSPGWTFRMRYVVVFELATADFDLGREPQLLLVRDGAPTPVPLSPLTGYDHQVRHLVAAISQWTEPGVRQTTTGVGQASCPPSRSSAAAGPNLPVTVAECVDVLRLLAAERESFTRRCTIAL